ncbi:hypothetical protein JG687_00014927 [Phytophthora cactorum]|uniref:Uncharacterized protein n=2 Tax=Phytophthora cactorum TaxID=29920 RepID=A0A8T1TV83_9STRA|nr:hypothetical protein GQ600_4938 [Phytophthora cactorum]KAG2829136.1 hypothetical protein PC112_g8220 [Phytophthora cactorum]KAG2860262.1 hypothetical protein PC113_g8222 [Phytophthora cactorum]KAG3189858.1 hypothetical protein PC128_g11570 [Phytophthora cactorum]KAG6949342.1 hypothetical protein JG687_00014927 [Phytophthora cactorum]
MRRLAMNEIGDDEANEDDSDSTTDNAAPAEGRKRPESALTGNVTKRERLAVVMDSLTDSLKSASEEDSHKYEYRSQRLAFDKEQAELKRQHDAVEADKRRNMSMSWKRNVDKQTKKEKSECLNSFALCS